MAERQGHYLVVGAYGGVGRETVALLKRKGHRVTGTIRPEEQDDAPDGPPLPVADRLIPVDMADAEAAGAALEAFFAQNHVDGVVICTGVAPSGPLETMSLDVVRQTFEVNTFSVLAVYQKAMPALRRSKGALVILGSTSGIVAIPFLGIYSASKFALEGMVDIMRREAYRWDVHVAILEPGAIATNMTVNQLGSTRAELDALSPASRDLYGELYESFHERVSSRLPGALTPAEVAAVACQALTERSVARYPVGGPAQENARMARTRSDAELDAQFRTAFGAALEKAAC